MSLCQDESAAQYKIKKAAVAQELMHDLVLQEAHAPVSLVPQWHPDAAFPPPARDYARVEASSEPLLLFPPPGNSANTPNDPGEPEPGQHGSAPGPPLSLFPPGGGMPPLRRVA